MRYEYFKIFYDAPLAKTQLNKKILTSSYVLATDASREKYGDFFYWFPIWVPVSIQHPNLPIKSSWSS